MATILTAADLEKAVRALIVAEKTNLGIEVTVPVAYGDGETVSVVVEQSGGEVNVHDAGLSAMRLSTSGVSLSRHVNNRLSEFAQRYRCEFRDGRVSLRATIADAAQAIALVANAARGVADYVYEIRRQAEADFRVIVVEKLREIVGRRVRETEEFKGESGRTYRIAVVLNAAESRPQNFISTIANRQAVSLSFATFIDLGKAYPDIERDAVYDDDAGLRAEDRKFLSSANAHVFGWMEAETRFREIALDAQVH